MHRTATGIKLRHGRPSSPHRALHIRKVLRHRVCLRSLQHFTVGEPPEPACVQQRRDHGRLTSDDRRAAGWRAKPRHHISRSKPVGRPQYVLGQEVERCFLLGLWHSTVYRP